VVLPRQRKRRVTAHTKFERTSSMKLHLAGMTSYARVLYVDVDIIIVGSLHRMLYVPEGGHELIGFSAWNSPLHGGILSVRPSSQAHSNLLRVYKEGRFDHDRGWDYDGPFLGGWAWCGERMPAEWKAKFCDGTRLAPWTFASAHHDQGLLFWWYAMRRGSFRDLHRYPFYAPGQLNHTFLELSSKFVPHVHFGGSPKPWSQALLGYDSNVWQGMWQSTDIRSLYRRIGQHSFPMIRGGQLTGNRKEALTWFRRYWTYYDVLLASGKPLPSYCRAPMRAIRERIAELWALAKDDPDDFPPPV